MAKSNGNGHHPPPGDDKRPDSDVAGLDPGEVRALLDKFQGVAASELRQFKRDHQLATWQATYFRAADELEKVAKVEPRSMAEQNSKTAAMRNCAIVMGISTEKSLLLSGQPTQIVAGIHEVRHQMPEIAAKIAEVAKRLALPPGDHPQRAPGDGRLAPGVIETQDDNRDG